MGSKNGFLDVTRQTLKPHTFGSCTHIWSWSLFYVDDLALVSTCPRELQAMLHVCIQNCVQINSEKTKIMVFFETLSAILRARGGQH